MKALNKEDLQRLEEIYKEIAKLHRELSSILERISLEEDYFFGKNVDTDGQKFIDVMRGLNNLFRNEVLDRLWEEFEKAQEGKEINK